MNRNEQLEDWVQAYLKHGYVFGETDCIRWALNWVELQTGNPKIAKLENWDSLTDALKKWPRETVWLAPLSDKISELLSDLDRVFLLKSLRTLKAGDVVLVRNPGRNPAGSLGIVSQNHCVLVPNHLGGFHRHPMSEGMTGWRVFNQRDFQ